MHILKSIFTESTKSPIEFISRNVQMSVCWFVPSVGNQNQKSWIHLVEKVIAKNTKKNWFLVFGFVLVTQLTVHSGQGSYQGGGFL